MPRKPIDIDLEKVEQLSATGLSQRQIAAALNISQSTITERMKNNPDFRDAMTRGHAKGCQAVVNRLYRAATDEDKPSVPAQIFFLKNRDRENWSDKHEVNASLSGGLSVDHDIESALQRLRDAGIDPRSL